MKPPVETLANPFSPGEEWANRLTHAAGAVLSLPGLYLLIRLALDKGDIRHLLSFTIFGLSLVALYFASTFYHTFQTPRLKRVLRVADHIGIYLLIAGSYTPFTLISLRGGVGWALFIAVWVMALAGIVFKVFYIGRFGALSVIGYLAMGWLILFALNAVLESIPTGGILLLAAGGFSYTVGVVFFLWEALPYNHAIWHLFVLGGSVTHYVAVVFHVHPPG